MRKITQCLLCSLGSSAREYAHGHGLIAEEGGPDLWHGMMGLPSAIFPELGTFGDCHIYAL